MFERFITFILGCMVRLITNLLSIKFQFFIITLVVCVQLLISGHLESADFATIIASVTVAVIAAKEIYKVASLRSIKDIPELQKIFPKIPIIKDIFKPK